MTAATTIVTYLGEGTHASRPTAPNIPSGGLALYYETDTTHLFFYDLNTASWVQIAGAAGAGTVTSVALALPADFSVSGSPVTTSGTLTGAYASPPFQPQGRLTLQPGVPVMTSDQAAKSTIYYDSHVGSKVPVYNGSTWTVLTITNDEISTGLDSVTPHIASGSVYDVFAVNNSGSLAIGVGPAWSSTTSRGTGAGTTELVKQNGIWTNKNSLTHLWSGASGTTDLGSISANQATYLGTFYATANGQTAMQIAPSAAAGGASNVLGLWNAYNRVTFRSKNRDSNGTWTYNSTTWRPLDGAASNTNNRITWVDGLQQSPVDAHASVLAQATANNACNIGLVIDSTTNTPTQATQAYPGSLANSQINALMSVRDSWAPQLGLHFIQAMECAAVGTATFDANDTTPTRPYEALILSLEM